MMTLYRALLHDNIKSLEYSVNADIKLKVVEECTVPYPYLQPQSQMHKVDG